MKYSLREPKTLMSVLVMLGVLYFLGTFWEWLGVIAGIACVACAGWIYYETFYKKELRFKGLIDNKKAVSRNGKVIRTKPHESNTYQAPTVPYTWSQYKQALSTHSNLVANSKALIIKLFCEKELSNEDSTELQEIFKKLYVMNFMYIALSPTMGMEKSDREAFMKWILSDNSTTFRHSVIDQVAVAEDHWANKKSGWVFDKKFIVDYCNDLRIDGETVWNHCGEKDDNNEMDFDALFQYTCKSILNREEAA